MKSIIVNLCLILMIGTSSIAQDNQKTSRFQVELSGSIEGAKEGDTVFLYVWDGLIDYSNSTKYLTAHRAFSAVIANGIFKLKVTEIRKATYFSLGLAKEKFHGIKHEILSLYLMEPNDKVNVHMTYSHIKNRVASGDGNFDSNRYKAIFSGKGAAKYNLAFLLKSATSPLAFLNRMDVEEAKQYTAKSKEYGYTEYEFNLWDRIKAEALQNIHAYEGKVSDEVLRLLSTDCLAWIEWNKLYKYNGLAFNVKNGDSTVRARREVVLNALYDRYCTPMSFNTVDTAIWQSPYLISYLNYRIINDQIRKGDPSSYVGVYENAKVNYTGELRERMIVSNYFTANGMDYFLNPDRQEVVQDMLKTLSSYTYYTLLQEYVNRVALGLPIKEFSLPDADGNYVSIADLKGKVVFLDLWYSGCGGCAAYYKGVLSKVEEKYKNHPEVKFITISIDGTKELWLKGLKGGAYTGEHAINLYTDGQGSQHPFIKHYNITGYPSPFLVDKDGLLIQRGAPLKTEQGLINEIEAALKK